MLFAFWKTPQAFEHLTQKQYVFRESVVFFIVTPI